MSDEDHAAGVAEDFRYALEDLTLNLRVEIATLTNVAKESITHAFAIAEVLKEHIKKAPAQKTLPALYVLDSIVKNIGTPYTLYFRPNLYSIFMGAYAKVDGATRQKMHEMLKTWKEPVPGSLDRRPVFPLEVVRPIENALVAATNVGMSAHQNDLQQQHHLLGRGRVPIPPRDTPTPPNVRPGSHQAGPYGQQPFPGPAGRSQQGTPTTTQAPFAVPSHKMPMNPNPSPFPNFQGPPPQPSLSLTGTPQPNPLGGLPLPPQANPRGVYGTPPPGLGIDKLKDDIQRLIDAEKAEFARNPLDTSKQTTLKALLDLQMLIQSPDVPQEHLILVKNKVAELSVNMRPTNGAPLSAHSQPTPLLPPSYTATPPVVAQQPLPVPPPVVVPSASASASVAPSPGTPMSFDSLFGQGALAALVAGAQRKTPTPQSAPATLAAIRSSPPQRPIEAARPVGAGGITTDPKAILAMLKQRGLVGGTPAPSSASVSASTPPPPPANLAAALGNLPSILSKVMPAASNLRADGTGADLNLKAASLKQARPALIRRIYDDLGPQCTQCGRRFKTDEEGRRKKMAHMDWHFRVNQRIVEAEKRGQHRSWYVTEQDWVNSRDTADEDPVQAQHDGGNPSGSVGAAGGGAGSNAPGGRTPKPKYIRAPDPGDTRTNKVCPICQEEFESEYMKEDGVDDWVWLDAVKVAERVFHASCWAAATKDRGGTPSNAAAARATPDSVLGKRKAEDEYQPFRSKTQLHGY